MERYSQEEENYTKSLRQLVLSTRSQFMQQAGGIDRMSYYILTVLTNVSNVYLTG